MYNGVQNRLWLSAHIVCIIILAGMGINKHSPQKVAKMQLNPDLLILLKQMSSAEEVEQSGVLTLSNIAEVTPGFVFFYFRLTHTSNKGNLETISSGNGAPLPSR